MEKDNWMSELLRVKFHHARENLAQCKEEVELLKTEIQWSANFFHYHANKWKKLATEAGQKRDKGRQCYSSKQAKIWGVLQEQA
ncbi:hypothetical protein BS17DRAFT_863797, partial [Gyrodon lividus]